MYLQEIINLYLNKKLIFSIMTDLKDNLDSAYSNLYSLSQDFGYILNLINIKITGLKNKAIINLATNIS